MSHQLIPPRGFGAASPSHADLQVVALNVEIELFHVREPARGLGRVFEVVGCELDLYQRPERAASDFAQAIALGERPVGVRILGEEVPAIEGQAAVEASCEASGSPCTKRVRPVRISSSNSSTSIHTLSRSKP